MTQLIVQFRQEFNVTYSGETFQSPSTEIILPINEILGGFPDAEVKQLLGGTISGAEERMKSYYTIYLDDPERAQDLERRLQSQPAIEAAYIKPPAEPPW